ncbi:MAG TPA: hypothetical protein VGJ20_41950 [Xanthobacteraceae bacterium]|jgi:hypothetical protein
MVRGTFLAAMMWAAVLVAQVQDTGKLSCFDARSTALCFDPSPPPQAKPFESAPKAEPPGDHFEKPPAR